MEAFLACFFQALGELLGAWLAIWAMVVAQLVKRSLPTSEIRGSNPVIGKILSTKLFTNCIIEKTKIKKKRPGIFKKTRWRKLGGASLRQRSLRYQG